MQYRFTRRYQSAFGTYAKGDIAEFDADTAAWLQRDCRGCLEPVTPEPEPRAVDAPPQDRQVKRAPRKRGRADG